MSSLQSNGIPFSRLINANKHTAFLELIKCKKCFNILQNPYDCSVCGNSFCYDCINNLLSEGKNCPFKCVSYSINISSFSITSYLSSIQFECLNKKNGCNEILDYNSLTIHDKDCKYFYTKCPNAECGKTMKWTLLENHIIKECDYSLFKCPNCEMELSRNQFNEHVTNCTNIRKSLSYSINPTYSPNTQKNNIAIQQDNQNRFDDLLKHLPDIKEMSLVSFLKILLYQINESNKTLNNKFDTMRDEMKSIHEDINRVCNNNMIFFESINNELESLNTKCDSMELSDSIKANIQESVQNALGNSQQDTTSSLVEDKKMLNNSMMSDYMPSKQRVKFAEILESTDKFKTSKEKQGPKQNQGLKEKKVKTMNLNKSLTSSNRKEREGAYSPRGNGHNYIPTTPNNDVMNCSIDIKSKGESGNVSMTTINPPIARPFNTFSNFTNSNLVTIINNQEVILKKLNSIEKKMNDKEQKLLDEIKETQDSYYNQMLLSNNVLSKLKISNENQGDQ